MTEPRPDPPEDRDPDRGATRPGASPGASGPGTPGYNGEVTVGDDGGDAGADDLVRDAVDDMDQRQGLDDPGRVAEATSPDDDDPGADRVANPSAVEGEAPTG